MGILKKILIVIGAIVVLFLLVAAFLPGEYSVQRSTVIDAPPHVVYPMVADLHKWLEWSPWVEMDPNAQYSFDGKAAKPGSKWSWKGEIVGEGSLTHDELIPNKSIKSSLTFVQPQQMSSTEEWTFEKTDGGTKVVWLDEGELGYPVGRYFGLFLDDMLGPDFEKGLAKLKTLSEAEADRLAKAAAEMKDEVPTESVE